MRHEYKRVLVNAGATIQDVGASPSALSSNPHLRKRHNPDGRVAFPDMEDEVEQMFNALGAEGWILQTAVNLDSGADSGACPAVNLIEYIFRRQVPVA